jgi:hypothetical protein
MDNTETEIDNHDKLNTTRNASAHFKSLTRRMDESNNFFRALLTQQNPLPKTDRPMTSELYTCRICLCDEKPGTEDNQNPMISPCKCTGTMRYIHLECLREW